MKLLGFEHCPQSGIPKTPETTILRKMDLLPPSGSGVGNTYSVGSFRKNPITKFLDL
jgi:hypothetical protein